MDVCLNETRKQISSGGIDRVLIAARLNVPSNRHDAAAANENVSVEDVETIVHRHDRRIPNDCGGTIGRRGRDRRIGGRPDHSALIRTLFIDMDDVSTPWATAMSSARMLTAISAGVTAPISRPIGEWTRCRHSGGMPSDRNAS